MRCLGGFLCTMVLPEFFFWCFYGWLSLSLDIEVAFLDYIAAVFSGVCFRFACDLL